MPALLAVINSFDEQQPVRILETSTAVSKEIPCFRWLLSFVSSSHSNLTTTRYTEFPHRRAAVRGSATVPLRSVCIGKGIPLRATYVVLCSRHAHATRPSASGRILLPGRPAPASEDDSGRHKSRLTSSCDPKCAGFTGQVTFPHPLRFPIP